MVYLVRAHRNVFHTGLPHVEDSDQARQAHVAHRVRGKHSKETIRVS